MLLREWHASLVETLQHYNTLTDCPLFFVVICHVVGITYQTIEHRLLAEMLGDPLGKKHTVLHVISIFFLHNIVPLCPIQYVLDVLEI